MRVSELMQTEVWQTFPEESLADAAARMRDHGIGSLPMMDGDELVGMLTERDLMWAMADGAPPNVTKVATYMSGAPVVAGPELKVNAGARLMVRHNIRHPPWSRTGCWWAWSRPGTCSSSRPGRLRRQPLRV